MTCSRCRKNVRSGASRCPHCGAETSETSSGVYQTSTVLIAADGTEAMYRSVEELPDSLRSRLLKSTNSPNSATIFIADQRGREEIAKALRNLPGGPQRRMIRSLLTGDGATESEAEAGWLTPRRKWILLGAVFLATLLLIAFVFLHRW